MQKPPTDALGAVIELGDYVLISSDGGSGGGLDKFVVGLVSMTIPKEEQSHTGRWKGDLRVIFPHYDFASGGGYATNWIQVGRRSHSCILVTTAQLLGSPDVTVSNEIADPNTGKTTRNLKIVLEVMEERRQKVILTKAA